MLYMFQAVSPPIIRSSKLYTEHLVYVKLACCYRSSKLYTEHLVYVKLACLLRPLAVAASKLDTYQMLCVQF